MRRAIAHALDRQAFLERVAFNQGAVADAPIHSGIGFAHGEGLAMPEHYPAMAAQLLEGAGWVDQGDGTRLAQGLINSIPRVDAVGTRLTYIPGRPPDPSNLPPGCPFQPRCKLAAPRCSAIDPPLVSVGTIGSVSPRVSSRRG